MHNHIWQTETDQDGNNQQRCSICGLPINAAVQMAFSVCPRCGIKGPRLATRCDVCKEELN